MIPVLVDGASIPRSGDLPDDLKPLVRRNALEVSHTRFKGDCARLIAALERILEGARAERQEKERAEALQRGNEGLEANLPSKEVLQAKLLGLLLAPATKLVRVLNEAARETTPAG